MLDKFKNLFKKGIEGGGDGYSVSDLFNSKDPSADTGLSFLNAYKLNLYVNKAIDIRAKKVSQSEFYFYDKKRDEIINEHPVLDLLYKPNELHTKTEFLNLLQKSKDVHGSAYIWMQGARKDPFEKLKTIDKMYVLPGNQVKILFDDKTNEIVFYEYTRPNGVKTQILAKDIIAFHHYDITNMTGGVSLLQSGMREIKTGSQLTDYQAKILKNGGKIDGVFNFKNSERLNKDQLLETKERYKQEYAEATKSGMPLFMAGEADYKRVSLSPEELNYLESRKANLNDVCIMTGVPRSLLGSFDEIKFDNADVSHNIFLRETIKPEVDNLKDKLNENVYLIPGELELKTQDVIPEDLDKILKKNESGIKNYYMTPNEARANVGLEPIDGGDELYVPFNMMPLGSEPEIKQDQSKKQKNADKVYMHPLKDKEIRRMYGKLYAKRTDRRATAFKKVLDEYLKGQEGRMTDTLEKVRQFKKKDIIDDLWNNEVEIKLGAEALLPIITQTLKESGRDVMDLIEYDYEFNITGQIRGWLDQKAQIFSEQINETTFKQLKKAFEASLMANETRAELAGRIKEVYKTISKGRADVIARTETHAASQKGQYEAYKQMNIGIKIWVWSPGIKGGTRDIHQAMDGEERPLDTPFSNGLMMPGEGPAEEVINCECTI